MQLVSGPILVTSGDTPKGCFPEIDLLEYYHGNGKSTIPIEKRGFSITMSVFGSVTSINPDVYPLC